MQLLNFVFKSFWSRLAATPAGRRHIYSFAIAAEEGDEHGVFDMLANNVADMEFKKLVRAHQADEERHAGLFFACLTRMGETPEKIPDALQIIRRMGGKFEAAGEQNGTVVELYAMLRAIEVRGVEQFPIIAEALRPYDAFGAETFRQVARDEARHVGFCDRIGRAAAGDEKTWQNAMAKYERIERGAFLEHGIVSFRYVLRQGLISSGPLEKAGDALLKGLEEFGARFGVFQSLRLSSL